MNNLLDNRTRRVLLVTLVLAAAILLLFHQLFHQDLAGETRDTFFIYLALVVFFAINIPGLRPSQSRCICSFTRRPPPSPHF